MKLEKMVTVAGENCLVETFLPYPKTKGKVRDCYGLGGQLLLVSSDRLSAFDRTLTVIPHKGQVLNQVSSWWFDKTHDIIDNHFIKMTSSNSMLVKKCEVIPLEVVVRGYLTGSTKSSIWTLYEKGEREFFGVKLADGLEKYQHLEIPLITPTTKEADHDRPLNSSKELQQFAGISHDDWFYIKRAALKLFHFASQVAKERGLILVDSKYEFGKDADGHIVLIDELHTPDNSRYWLLDSYNERLKKGESPERFDKEFIRLWYKQRCDPYHDEVLPVLPEKIALQLSEKYQTLYQMLTENKFKQENPSCAVLSELPVNDQ